jgi:hypothetical protein
MTKILVLDDRQFQELKRIFDAKMPTPWVMEDLENTNFYYSIQFAFECAEKKNRSVLEWHPMSEKPKDESDILVREKDGCVFDTHAFDSVDDGDWEIVQGDKNQIVEWTYPPE